MFIILNTRTINDDQAIKIYKDRNKNNHPSIELYFDEVNKKWVRIGEITHKKIKGQRYIDLDVNPNPDDTSPAFIRKYIESSKIGHRGEQIKKYKIHSSDVPKLINYLEKRDNNRWYFKNGKLDDVRNGNILVIPKNELSSRVLSGVNHSELTISLDKLHYKEAGDNTVVPRRYRRFIHRR